MTASSIRIMRVYILWYINSISVYYLNRMQCGHWSVIRALPYYHIELSCVYWVKHCEDVKSILNGLIPLTQEINASLKFIPANAIYIYIMHILGHKMNLYCYIWGYWTSNNSGLKRFYTAQTDAQYRGVNLLTVQPP